MSLVLELTIFFYKGLIRNPEIEKKNPSEFCPIFGDCGKLEISNLSRMSLMKCYWKLQNSSIPAFNVSELLRENQQ